MNGENWDRRTTLTHRQTGTGSTAYLSHVLPFCSYAGRVVGNTLKAQRENPELTVRNTDPVLKGAKQRLEQLTQVNARTQCSPNLLLPRGPVGRLPTEAVL